MTVVIDWAFVGGGPIGADLNPLVQMSNLDYYEMTGPAAGEIAEDESLPLSKRISRLEKQMKAAARRLEFEEAAVLRDRLLELQEIQILRS